jgi:acetoin utilization protein AcuB
MYSNTPIIQIMTRRPETIAPTDTMETARTIFERFGFHHIPVSEHGKLSGMLSYTDYLRVLQDLFGPDHKSAAGDNALKTMYVKEVMTENVLCLQENDTVENALRIFKTNHFHALPVVDIKGHLLGIVTTHDILKVLERVFAEQRSTTTEV